MKKESLFSIAGLVVIYEFVAHSLNKSVIFPSSLEVVQELFRICQSSTFMIIILATLCKTLITFSIVLILSLVFGIVAGYSKLVQSLLSPLITLLRTIPTVSFIIIFLIWLGSELGPIFIVWLVVFPILYELILGAMNTVNMDLRDVCLLFGSTPLEKFKALYYPQVIVALNSGIQATLGLSFKVMVMAEVMSQSRIGIGQALNYEKTYLNMAGVFAWSIVLVLIVLLFDWVIGMVIRGLMKDLE